MYRAGCKTVLPKQRLAQHSTARQGRGLHPSFQVHSVDQMLRLQRKGSANGAAAVSAQTALNSAVLYSSPEQEAGGGLVLLSKGFLSFNADDGRTKPVPRKGHTESFEPADNKCLLRATDGKKKISTVVSASFGLGE